MRKLLLITGEPVAVLVCRQQVHLVPVLRSVKNPKHRRVPDGDNQEAAIAAKINTGTRFN